MSEVRLRVVNSGGREHSEVDAAARARRCWPPMNRLARRPHHDPPLALRMLAIAIAVLLPLESAHCLWMKAPRATPHSSASANHACCPAPASRPASACPCLELPPAALTALVVAPPLERAVAVAPAAVDAAPIARVALGIVVPADETPPDVSAPPPRPARGPPPLA